MVQSVGWMAQWVGSLVLASGLATASAAAQDDPAGPAEQRATFERTCRKMSNLQSVAFETRDERDSVIEGTAAYEFVRHRFGDDEIVRFRGRSIARGAGIGWCVRERLLAGGEAPPFLLQPELFFQVLGSIAESDLEFTRDLRVPREQGNVRILSMTIRGDGAAELALSGALPRPSVTSTDLTAVIIAQRIGAGQNRRGAKPDITYHLALHLDPDSGLVRELHARGEESNSVVLGGNVVIRMGQPAGGFRVQQAAPLVRPPVPLAPADAAPKAADTAPASAAAPGDFDASGLPAAAPAADRSVISLHATFRNHDLPFVPELDERARSLLRYR